MNNLIAYLNQFSPVSEQILGIAEAIFARDELKKGEYFIREGEYAKEMTFLENGVVRAFYTDCRGKEYNKTLFVAPAVIGSYAALISKEKNRLPQQALTDCT